jgi:tetratricopeptide (TPR) repeat protein
MAEQDLQSKFPDMRPVKSAPALSTINGIGCTVYGSRDHDEETNTYVKTHAFSVLFVPLINLGAYRVADSPNGGWYFIGRVPLSTGARLWNLVLLAGVVLAVGLGWWHHYTHTPDYLAGQKLDEADRLAAAGQLVPAGRLYRDVAQGTTKRARDAVTRFKGMLDGPVARAQPAEAAAVLAIAAELKDKIDPKDLTHRGLELAKQHAGSDPRGALVLVDTVAPLLPDDADTAKTLADVRRSPLQKLVAQESDNPGWASRLAEIYEADRKPAKCEELLARHVKRLGTLEGARILGQIYARRGKIEEAHALLVPYAENRLKAYHEAEETIRQIHGRIFAQLKAGQVSQTFRDRYQGASQDEQRTIVQEYINGQVEADPAGKGALAILKQNRQVVPMALDLGMVLLHRAQAMADPQARRRELEKAEKTFLAVQGQAGEDDFYRLNLGEVYYWLGKHTEGRKLIDQVLAAQKRRPEILMVVGRLLRHVGEVSQARSLVEEAYRTETDQAKKERIAAYRSVLAVDGDDRITWLRKSTADDLAVRAELASALGQKALREGKDEEAARQLRESIACYARQPESSATLNNSAGVYEALYLVTGDRAALDKKVQRYEKALALEPRNSIILNNVARSTEEAALRDFIGDRTDLKLLKREGALDLLGYLCADQTARRRLSERLGKHPGIARARELYDRLLLLAPKSTHGYSAMAALVYEMNDLEKLRGLWRRLEQVELDLADQAQEERESLAGKKDAQNRKAWQAASRRAAATLRAARQRPRGTTLAVAADTLAQYQSRLALLGESVDADEVVRLAEEAHGAAPSQATRSSLMGALLFRGDRSLVRREPAYAAMSARAMRSLGPTYLIAVALSREGKPRQAALTDKDVQRVLNLIREKRAKEPEEADEWSWAMLSASHPDEAAAAAKVLQRDELRRLKRAIELKLAPMSGPTAFQAYWARQMAGEGAKGVEILKACAARGVPLPFELK